MEPQQRAKSARAAASRKHPDAEPTAGHLRRDDVEARLERRQVPARDVGFQYRALDATDRVGRHDRRHDPSRIDDGHSAAQGGDVRDDVRRKKHHDVGRDLGEQTVGARRGFPPAPQGRMLATY